MTDPTVTPLDKFAAPYGREVILQDVEHESGMRLLRIRIREGNRFTIMDVDAETAARWGNAMTGWARETNS